MSSALLARPLRRQGSWLFAPGSHWQIAAVHGPLSPPHPAEAGRQYFRVETTAQEILVISRAVGERGMRDLRLDSILPPHLTPVLG